MMKVKPETLINIAMRHLAKPEISLSEYGFLICEEGEECYVLWRDNGKLWLGPWYFEWNTDGELRFVALNNWEDKGIYVVNIKAITEEQLLKIVEEKVNGST